MASVILVVVPSIVVMGTSRSRASHANPARARFSSDGPGGHHAQHGRESRQRYFGGTRKLSPPYLDSVAWRIIRDYLGCATPARGGTPRETVADQSLPLKVSASGPPTICGVPDDRKTTPYRFPHQTSGQLQITVKPPAMIPPAGAGRVDTISLALANGSPNKCEVRPP